MNALQAERESRAPDIPPKTLVAEWTVNGRTVCLFQMPDRFGFSTEGPTGQLTTFNSLLYEKSCAINFIKMFHRTIGVNLEKEEPHSSCFLPKFCTEVRNARRVNVQRIVVALFGQVDTGNPVLGACKGMRWGVLNVSTREEQTFEVSDPVAEEFIRHAPRTNQPHLTPLLNKNGTLRLDEKKQPVMVPTKDHYAMVTYAKQFDAVLDRDLSGVIQKVMLVRTSIFDKKVRLDEHSWAVTLVSKQSGTTVDRLAQVSDCRIGHAMLAYEGVEVGGAHRRQFLAYIHITHQPESENSCCESIKGYVQPIKSWVQSIRGGPAKVEICEDEACPHWKSSVLVGPTWPRPSTVIKQIIVSATQNGTVDFALLGHHDSLIIAWGGGAGVLGVASWARSCFIQAQQSAYEILKTVNVSKIPSVRLQFSKEIRETYYRIITAAKYTNVAYATLALCVMFLTYRVVRSRSHRQNCADWTISTASRMGIIIRGIPNTIITANELVMYLRLNPSIVEIVPSEQ